MFCFYLQQTIRMSDILKQRKRKQKGRKIHSIEDTNTEIDDDSYEKPNKYLKGNKTHVPSFEAGSNIEDKSSEDSDKEINDEHKGNC